MNNISEICWIVNMRNEWASRRGKLRSRIHYYESLNNLTPRKRIKLAALKKKFLRVNAEKSRLNKHTLRLKRLLKKEKGWLVSDSSAGYSCVNFMKRDDADRPRPVMISKNEIANMAVIFETSRALEKILLRSRSTKHRKDSTS